MKKAFILLCAFLVPNLGHAVVVTVNTAFAFAIATTAGTPIPTGTGSISVGYFSSLADGAIMNSNITTISTSFQPFTTSVGVFGNASFPGFVNFATSDLRLASTPVASPFIGKNIYAVFGNQSTLLASTQLAVFKSDLLFTADSGNANPDAPTIGLPAGLPNATGSFVMGTNNAAIQIPIGGGNFSSVPGVNMVTVVPEPSALLLSTVGLLALLRRRR